MNSPPVSATSWRGTAGTQPEFSKAFGTAATRSGNIGSPLRWQALQPEGVDVACWLAAAF
ncbi:hypothetical protein [Erwinia sp. JUb26]|uniref:hypothetical protein n=1 Tax=Erwinia sp. JUb26 TaxID=2485126 RepID=UPI0011CD6730|nr:hypothetical protein [Erwinia sp. JUb26]